MLVDKHECTNKPKSKNFCVLRSEHFNMLKAPAVWLKTSCFLSLEGNHRVTFITHFFSITIFSCVDMSTQSNIPFHLKVFPCWEHSSQLVMVVYTPHYVFLNFTITERVLQFNTFCYYITLHSTSAIQFLKAFLSMWILGYHFKPPYTSLHTGYM